MLIESQMKQELKKIKAEVLDCKKCSLYQSRKYPVIGQGNHEARIMFIGEAPGWQEDQTGIPFCGKDGIVLDILLKSIDIDRKEVYICNLIKCRPPNNRDPFPDEIQACRSYLRRQIDIVKPKVICTLGRYSMAFINHEFGLGFPESISQVHGKVLERENYIFIPFYHPAVAAYNSKMMTVMLKDIKILSL